MNKITTRRSILFTLCASATFACGPVWADVPSLDLVGAAFREMPFGVRSRAQMNLIASGAYMGPQDGLWGPGTAEGFRQFMNLSDYREFAATLPADPMAAARETVLWASPEVFSD